MHPILFQFPENWPLVGGHIMHTYGALVALGFFLGLLWVRYESNRLHMPTQKLLDLFFYIVLASIFGARTLYVIISYDEWWKDPLIFIRFWEGGIVFYGGFIGAVLVTLWYVRKHQLKFLSVADVFVPGLALGHAIGRVGCFMAGCCFGKACPADYNLGVIFPHSDYGIAPAGVALYPTQLFEAISVFCLFLFLVFWRRIKHFEGEIFLLYITLYPILRAIIENYRGDTIRGFVVENVLSTSQFISIIWVGIACIIWATILKRKKV